MIGGPDPVERPDEAALEELRRAFEEPGEQFGGEIDEAALDLSAAGPDSGVERATRRRSARRWAFGRRRAASSGDRSADDPDGDRDAPAPAVSDSGWTDPHGSDVSMVRVLEPHEQIPQVDPGGAEPIGGAGADAAVAAGLETVGAGNVEPVRIDDEDLPDPVYLDGRLEPSGRPGSGGAEAVGPFGESDVDSTLGRAVVIDDDLGPDPIDTVAGARTSVTMEPRIRDRRVEVRRAIGRKRLRVLIGVAAALLVAVGALAVLGSPLFGVRADQIEVVGAVYTDRAALTEIIDDVVGSPTLTLDTERVEQQLRAIAWVEQARVQTSFPHRLTIDIRERVPLATFQGPDGLFRVIDRHGRVLDVIRGQPVAYLPLEIPEVDDLAQGQFTTRGPAAAAELVQALTPGIRQRVETMEVALDGSQLVVVLAPWEASPAGEPVRVQFGSTSDLLVKLVRLESVLQTAAERSATEIDVSTVEVSIR